MKEINLPPEVRNVGCKNIVKAIEMSQFGKKLRFLVKSNEPAEKNASMRRYYLTNCLQYCCSKIIDLNKICLRKTLIIVLGLEKAMKVMMWLWKIELKGNWRVEHRKKNTKQRI